MSFRVGLMVASLLLALGITIACSGADGDPAPTVPEAGVGTDASTIACVTDAGQP